MWGRTVSKPDFKLELHFDNVCDKCNSNVPIKDYCQSCLKLIEGEREDWTKMIDALEVN